MMPLSTWTVSFSEKAPFFDSAPSSWLDRVYIAPLEQLEDEVDLALLLEELLEHDDVGVAW